MPEGDTTKAAELHDLSVKAGDASQQLSINFGRGDLPYTTEAERREWQSRQIAELRYALLGDELYGVHGLVDAVRNQRIWLIILTIAMGVGLLLLLYQQFQIHQILQRLG